MTETVSEADVADEKKLAKQVKLEKEKQKLLTAIAGGDFSTMRAKVAGVLNIYPHTRNSDIALTLKYWEMFQPDIYNANNLQPRDLFKLERLHYLVRARAKIQNEYGLFQADEKIQGHRKAREEEMHEAVLQDVNPRRVISIFADETGKNDEFVIVAAIWVLSGRSTFTITTAIQAWQQKSDWAKREVHFAKFGRNDLNPLSDYLRVIQENREFLSFKIIAVERARTNGRIEDTVMKLHEHMLIRGIEHEIETNRIDLPRDIALTIDEDQALDAFKLADMKRNVSMTYDQAYGQQIILSSVETISSRKSSLVQLADLVAGSINRRLNHHGDRGVKDDIADTIINEFGLVLDEERIPGLDSTALFRV
jgi:hypothetical protein